ncbi:CBASS cGAMP-activated phospholipase [Microbacterium sp. STN6]|uniref:CBASS cGAMP-activated phospholipase n=1 Tax=Microbacterium sp. STN6 TaxID=2995588 RepID=UPI002260E88C|nr:CBASS cGAMP-activated phospholipase [Microbacterium sp. STN6]MCX7522058.1 CBASS cGAMP-activated phospholipase [Microbacterium sp. STN6]
MSTEKTRSATPRRALTIDGGGIKGVFPAAFLADLESELEQPLASYFDLIVGTSTGGIIALALGLGIPAADILSFYEKKGPTIFKGSRRLGPLRQLVTAKYDPAPLRAALEEVFGARRLGESSTRLVIPALNLSTGEVNVFKTAHHERFERDYKMLAVDAAMATAAAPTYFPTHRLTNGIPLVDGGTWANNPMGAAAVEAIGLLEWQKGEVELLAVGCTEAPANFEASQTRRHGLANYWARRIVRVFMSGQSSASIGTAVLLLGHDHVVRVSPSVDERQYRLDGVQGIPELRALGADQARTQLPLLRKRFFATPVESFVPMRKLEDMRTK